MVGEESLVEGNDHLINSIEGEEWIDSHKYFKEDSYRYGYLERAECLREIHYFKLNKL